MVVAVAPRRGGRAFACRGQVDGGLVFVGFAAVVGLDLVGVALLPARLALGELLVELARVEEDERRELDRARRRVDRAAVAGLDQQRDEAAMVEVGMGQEHGVEVGCIEGERDPVADRFVRAALEHPAVDEDPGPLGDEQELRAGDGRRATEEVDLHGAHGDSAGAPPSYPPGPWASRTSSGPSASCWRRSATSSWRGRAADRSDPAGGSTRALARRYRARRRAFDHELDGLGAGRAVAGDDARAHREHARDAAVARRTRADAGRAIDRWRLDRRGTGRGPGEGRSLPALRRGGASRSGSAGRRSIV